MATICNGAVFGYWNTSSNTRYCYINGTISRSENTVTLSGMTMYWTFANPSWGNIYKTMNVGDSSTSVYMNFGNSGSNPTTTSNTVSLNDYSFSVTTTQTSATIIIEEGGDTGSFTVSFPSGATAPADPTITNTYSTGSLSGSAAIGFTFNTTSWGSPGQGRFEYYYGTTSTTTENYTLSPSTGYTSELTNDYLIYSRDANTRYYVRVREWNGYLNNPSGLITTSIVTVPAVATNQSVTNIETTSARINWTAPADGGVYSKTYYYSLDDGTTWVACGTVSGGTATSMYYDITGMTPATSYTIKLKVVTTAGTRECNDFNAFSTLAGLYGSVNNQATRVKKLYGSVNGVAKEIKHVYGSVNGVTKKIF